MTAINPPRIRRTAFNSQFTYNLSRRVNDLQTYPVQSPQGATILIDGHENGVTIYWRGGRRLVPAKKESPKEKQNGASEDAVMIIDSDDEGPPAKGQPTPKFVDKPVFEDSIEEGPYPEIVQTLDLTLGTAVARVAVLPITPCSASEVAGGEAAALSEKMVFAVSCVTNDVYLITLPLTPPSEESKLRSELKKDLLAGKAGSGAWGETLVLLAGQNKSSESLAITLVTTSTTGRTKLQPRIVVAAHTREASGILRLWDIPLEQKPGSEPRHEPFQTEFLPHPLKSISFNPVHSTQLLTVSSTQGARIYDFALPSFPPDSEAIGLFPVQGSWLLSLYQPFTKPTSSRKPILDAAWIAHGRAIFALLADGQWGIWDLDGASPSTSGTAMSNKLRSGLHGSALTAFSASGVVEGTSSLRSVATQQKQSNSGGFAPMTPHTRRQVTASLSSAITSDNLAMVRGGVKVMALPSTGSALQDETVAIWIGTLEHVSVIPGVMRFWESQLRKGNAAPNTTFSAFTTDQPVKIVKVPELTIGLLGERCCGVSLLPATSPRAAQDGGIPADIVVQGETRLVVVRESEDGPGKRSGALVTRRRLFSTDDKSEAIIVHGKRQASSGLSFNLSTVKPGTLRKKSLTFSQDEPEKSYSIDEDAQRATRIRGGLSFTSTLNAAADNTNDFTKRNVEAEMLDIMEIDQALQTMEGSRNNTGQNVFFEGFS